MTREDFIEKAATEYANAKHPDWDKFQRAYSEIAYSEAGLHDKAGI